MATLEEIKAQVRTLLVDLVTEIIADLGVGSDTVPNPLSFTSVANAALSTVYESNAITVLGIDAATSISISNGFYSINDGPYVASIGTVVLNDVLKVKHTSSASNATAVVTRINIGGVEATFTSTTIVAANATSVPVIQSPTAITIDEGLPIDDEILTDVPCAITIRSGNAGELFEITETSIPGAVADYESMPSLAVGKTLTVPLRATRLDNPTKFTDFSMTYTIADVSDGGGAISDSTNHGAGSNLFAVPSAIGAGWDVSGVGVSSNVESDWDLVYPEATGTFRLFKQPLILAASTPYTMCIDVEAAGMNWIFLTTGQGLAYAEAWYNVATGVVGTTANTPTCDVLALGSSKFRLRLRKTSAASPVSTGFAFVLVDADGSYTATANGTNGIKVRNAYLGTTS